jgi:hypothetical protein
MLSRFRRRRRVVTAMTMREVDINEVIGGDIDTTKDEDMKEVEEDPPLVLNMVR